MKRVNADDVEPVDVEGTDADILPVGYHLGTEESRSNLWVLDEGDEIFRHRQEEQEEVYHVLEGMIEFEVGDGESFVVGGGGFAAVSPEEPREAVALKRSRVFIIGAPPAKDDGVRLD